MKRFTSLERFILVLFLQVMAQECHLLKSPFFDLSRLHDKKNFVKSRVLMILVNDSKILFINV